MPIRAEMRDRYPADWKAISLRVRGAAGWRCQECGVRGGAWGYRNPGGEFVELPTGDLRRAGHESPPFNLGFSDGRVVRVIKIVLTVAHLDHDPSNCDDANLRAWCQRCHLRYDAAEHARTRAATLRARAAVGDLPGIIGDRLIPPGHLAE